MLFVFILLVFCASVLAVSLIVHDGPGMNRLVSFLLTVAFTLSSIIVWKNA